MVRVPLGKESVSGGASASPSQGGGATADESGQKNSFMYGLIVLAGGTALVLGIKRLLRRG